MNEQLLSFIWKNHLFSTLDLKTVSNQGIQIINLGVPNTDSGPDFINACIVIDRIKWFGWIEIHTKSSDWLKHRHDTNRNYDAVILHVVYEHDLPKNTIARTDHSIIPMLVLKSRISHLVLEQYALLDHQQKIPCFSQLGNCNVAVVNRMQEKVLKERFLNKVCEIRALWQKNQQDWEETFYQKLASHFGFKKNNDNFLRLARSIPRKIILKHMDSPFQIESLFFGQAGFLDSLSDQYAKKLHQEYLFLAHKYQIGRNKLKRSDWRFLRMRPANFPTLRLAQWVTLLYITQPTFDKIIHSTDISAVRRLFSFELPKYWQHHYDFGKTSTKTLSFGEKSVDSLMINVICFMYFFYGKEKKQQNWLDKSFEILKQLPAEDNKVTRQWHHPKILNKSAFQSQSLLELYYGWCQPKKCLSCCIGKHILMGEQTYDIAS